MMVAELPNMMRIIFIMIIACLLLIGVLGVMLFHIERKILKEVKKND